MLENLNRITMACAFLRYNPDAMPRRKAPEDLSVEELRRLLIEKRRGVGLLQHIISRVALECYKISPPSGGDIFRLVSFA